MQPLVETIAVLIKTRLVLVTGPKDDESKADMSGDEPVPTVNGTLRQRAGTPRHR